MKPDKAGDGDTARRRGRGPEGRQKGSRQALRRGIVILPNAFTLGNLFFGFWAIISALRGDYSLAAWLVFAAALADALDGRVARFARTGSPFGTELDSLVDLVSFGVAPAVLVYRLFLEGGDWSWTLSFIWISAVALRLARFNIEQGGHARIHFHGLPSPAAGVTLAAFYPFSQTPFFETYLSAWPWTTLIGGGMIVVSGLMLSHILYAAVPPISLRSARGRIGLAVIVGSGGLLVWNPELVLFPVGLLYITYGAVKAVTLGLLERVPERDPLGEELELAEEEEASSRDLEYDEMRPKRSIR